MSTVTVNTEFGSPNMAITSRCASAMGRGAVDIDVTLSPDELHGSLVPELGVLHG